MKPHEPETTRRGLVLGLARAVALGALGATAVWSLRSKPQPAPPRPACPDPARDPARCTGCPQADGCPIRGGAR